MPQDSGLEFDGKKTFGGWRDGGIARWPSWNTLTWMKAPEDARLIDVEGGVVVGKVSAYLGDGFGWLFSRHCSIADNENLRISDGPVIFAISIWFAILMLCSCSVERNEGGLFLSEVWPKTRARSETNDNKSSRISHEREPCMYIYLQHWPGLLILLT